MQAESARRKVVRGPIGDRMTFWSACRLRRPRNRFSDQQRRKRRDERAHAARHEHVDSFLSPVVNEEFIVPRGERRVEAARARKQSASSSEIETGPTSAMTLGFATEAVKMKS